MSNYKLIEDLRKARDDELSLTAAIVEVCIGNTGILLEERSNENQDLAADYTLGRNTHTSAYHWRRWIYVYLISSSQNQIHITLRSFGTSSTEISEYCFRRPTMRLYEHLTKLFLWQVVSCWEFSSPNIRKRPSGFYDKIGPRSVQMTPYRRLYAEAWIEYSWERPSVKIYSIRASCVFLTTCTAGQNPDWLALTLKFSKVVVIGGRIISLFPGFLQP